MLFRSVRVVRKPVGDGRTAGSEAAEVVAALGLGLVKAAAGVPAVLDQLIGT